MIVRETGTNGLVDLESALWREELDARWLERVVFRKEQGAPEVATLIRALLEAEDQEVPCVDIALHRRGHKVCQVLSFQDHLVLCLQSAICHTSFM